MYRNLADEAPSMAFEMASLYKPALCLHSRETCAPTDARAMIDNSVLKRRGSPEDDIVTDTPTIEDLYIHHTSNYYLEGMYDKDDLHLGYGQYGYKTYARIAYDPEESWTVIQYYFFYLYNDWMNQHQGDWESIHVLFESDDVEAIAVGDMKPTVAGYSKHAAPRKRPWHEIESINGIRPLVYVGRGSHASYFRQATYLIPVMLLRSGLYLGAGIDRTGKNRIEELHVELLPDQSLNPAVNGWLRFRGCWGRLGAGLLQTDGPTGPACKAQWHNPRGWVQGLENDRSTPWLSVSVPA